MLLGRLVHTDTLGYSAGSEANLEGLREKRVITPPLARLSDVVVLCSSHLLLPRGVSLDGSWDKRHLPTGDGPVPHRITFEYGEVRGRLFRLAFERVPVVRKTRTTRLLGLGRTRAPLRSSRGSVVWLPADFSL
jgi:hypothetical protein